MLTRKHDRVSTRALGSFTTFPMAAAKWKAGPGHLLGHPSHYRFRIAYAEQPIVIQAGAVAWTEPKKYFGVRFVSLEPHEERALNRYLILLK
jgi:hypothetical protein